MCSLCTPITPTLVKIIVPPSAAPVLASATGATCDSAISRGGRGHFSISKNMLFWGKSCRIICLQDDVEKYRKNKTKDMWGHAELVLAIRQVGKSPNRSVHLHPRLNMWAYTAFQWYKGYQSFRYNKQQESQRRCTVRHHPLLSQKDVKNKIRWLKQLEHGDRPQNLLVDHDSSTISKWLFQPSWNMFVKMVIFPSSCQNQTTNLYGHSSRSAGLGIS